MRSQPGFRKATLITWALLAAGSLSPQLAAGAQVWSALFLYDAYAHSARSEALGRSVMALQGDPLLALDHPALLTSLRGSGAAFDQVGPIAGDSDWLQSHLRQALAWSSIRLPGELGPLALAAGVRQLRLEPRRFRSAHGAELYQLSVAAPLGYSTSFGLSGQLYRSDLGSDSDAEGNLVPVAGSTPLLTLSLLHSSALDAGERIELFLGASLVNALAANMYPDQAPHGPGWAREYDLPRLARLGGGLRLDPPGLPVRLLLVGDWRKDLNREESQRLSGGAELDIHGLLKLRGGYHWKENVMSTPAQGSIDAETWTWGLGIGPIPMGRLHFRFDFARNERVENLPFIWNPYTQLSLQMSWL